MDAFLVAARPAPGTSASEGPAQAWNVPGLGSLPRIIAWRATRAEADNLARVLELRGRGAVVLERATAGTGFFEGTRLLRDAGRLVLERSGGGRLAFLPEDTRCVIDLRMKVGGPPTAPAAKAREEMPERALLLVPASDRGEPGLLSTRSLMAGAEPLSDLTAARVLQEAVTLARAALPGKVVELRASPGMLGMDTDTEDALALALAIFSRLPPDPAAPAAAPARTSAPSESPPDGAPRGLLARLAAWFVRES
jgi:hypothetical protein